MFSVLQSPYNFNTSIFMNPILYRQEPKRRRIVHDGEIRRSSDVKPKRYTPVSLGYEVEKNDRGYVLSVYKTLREYQLRNEINHDLSILKDQLYRPTYYYSELFGGLVEEEPDEDSLTRQAMSKLNVSGVCRRVARQAFKDYKIELNHRGDGLSIVSSADGVLKEFDLGVTIDDLEVVGCQLNKSCTQAVWRILLVESDKMGPLCKQVPVQPNTEGVQQFREQVYAEKEGNQLTSEDSIIAEELGMESEVGPELGLKLEIPEKEPGKSSSELGQALALEACQPLKIDVNFPHKETPGECQRNVPILEEIEDEEVDRYRRLVCRAPSGTALVEGC